MSIFLEFLQQFTYFFNTLYSMLNSISFLIVLQIVSCCVLIKIIGNLFKKLFQDFEFEKKQSLFILFIIPLIAIIAENISTIAKFAFPKTPATRILLCIAWILSYIKFHSFLLFLERLTVKNFNLKFIHKIFFIIETILCCLCITDVIHLITYNQHIYLSNYFYYASVIFWFVSIIPSIITIIHNISHTQVPIILKKQLITLLCYFLIPHIVCIFLEFAPILCSGTFSGENFIIAYNNLDIILIISSFYFCYSKIMTFRFLNLSHHVQAQPKFQITTQFKDSIEYLNTANNYNELLLIAQNFFHEQFNLHKKDINLYILSNQTDDFIQKNLEAFFNNEKSSINPLEIALIRKIFVYDEIDFDAYCSDSTIAEQILIFLKSINCNILIPVLHHKKLLGFITVQRHNSQPIYNIDQQNKMIVFAQFLGTGIHTLAQYNTYKIMQESKELKEALYAKHQEVNQYKESIKKLLKDRIENNMGIIFYKNRHFTFKNQEAQQILDINPNTQNNHPTTIQLLNLAQSVEKFKTTQSLCITLHNGKKLIVAAMPHCEPSGGIFMTIRYPEPTDIIKLQLDALKDPSKRDYLLYLETTQAGQLINKLLPSNSESILLFKIKLLEIALQKNSMFLQAHQNDINDFATTIHKISIKEAMHIINLQGTIATDCSVDIFGINPLLQQTNQTSLLEKLDGGILIIKNMQYLDHVTQQKLVYFIRYGIFSPLKSEQRKYSDVRIIFASQESLYDLRNSHAIIPELYEELQKCNISLSSIYNFNKDDLSNLIDGFIQQANGTENSCSLTLHDKNMLLESGIESFNSFKEKVLSIIQTKQFIQENVIKTSLSNSDLEVAAQLGKQALKDVKLMTSLWQQLRSQTKIAELIGVNRSSVNRRCKDYNLV